MKDVKLVIDVFFLRPSRINLVDVYICVWSCGDDKR